MSEIILTKNQAKNKAYQYKTRYQKKGYEVIIENDGYKYLAKRDNGQIKGSQSFHYASNKKKCKKCSGAFTPDKSKVLCNDCYEYNKITNQKYHRRKLFECVVCGSKKTEDLVTDHTTDDYKGLWCDTCYRKDMDQKDINHDMNKFLELNSQMSCSIDHIRRFGFGDGGTQKKNGISDNGNR